MNGWSVLGWVCLAALSTVIEGLAVAFAVIFIKSALNSARPTQVAYRSKSHE